MTPYAAAQLAEPHPSASVRTPLAAPPPVVHESRVTPLLPAVPVALQRRHSDAWLVARVGRLRPDPFDVLFERHWADVHAYCRRILGSADDAQDCAQDAMMRAYQRLWRTKDAPPFKPLLFAIARNASIDRLRERRRDGGPVEEHHVAAAAGADQLAADRSRVDLLVDDLRGLSSRQRKALVLREASGLSHSDIAATLDTTPARVKSLISEARQALTERRAGRDLTCEDYKSAVASARGRLQNQRLLGHRAACARCGDSPLALHVLGLPALALMRLLSSARRALMAAGASGGAPVAAKIAVAIACVATATAPAVQTPPFHIGDQRPASMPVTIAASTARAAASATGRATPPAAAGRSPRATAIATGQATADGGPMAASAIAGLPTPRQQSDTGAVPTRDAGLRGALRDAVATTATRLRGQLRQDIDRTGTRLRQAIDAAGPQLRQTIDRTGTPLRQAIDTAGARLQQTIDTAGTRLRRQLEGAVAGSGAGLPGRVSPPHRAAFGSPATSQPAAPQSPLSTLAAALR